MLRGSNYPLLLVASCYIFIANGWQAIGSDGTGPEAREQGHDPLRRREESGYSLVHHLPRPSKETRPPMTWQPLLVRTEQTLEDRINSMLRAIDFYDKAMSQSDNGTGARRDAIDWLRQSAEEVSDAYFAYKASQQ